MLTLLAFLILSPHAHAAKPPKVLQTIQVDLDGDGKPDTVSIITLGTPNDVLEVVLSKDKRRLQFPKLLVNFPFHAEPNHGCASEGENTLTAGDHSFKLHQRYKSIDACAGEYGVESIVELVKGELKIRNAKAWSVCWAMGDPCLGHYQTFDFAQRLVKVQISDAHSSRSEPEVSEPMGAACPLAVSLEEFQAHGIPACLNAQAAYIEAETRGPDSTEDGPSLICPILDGTYSCTYKDDDGKIQKDSIESIRRNQGAIFSYDLRGLNTVLIADGKKYPQRQAGNKDNYDLTTCRRDELSLHRYSFDGYESGAGQPSTKEETLWKQLDLTGDRFHVSYSELTLGADGKYSVSFPWQKKEMDCKRQRAK